MTLSLPGVVEDFATQRALERIAQQFPLAGQNLANGSITSAHIKDGEIVNADVSASAAIAYSKLAALTSGNILVGNGSNVPTSVAMSGDVTISNAGVTTIGASKVTSGMILNGTVADGDLASPNNSTYKLLGQAAARAGSGAAGLYIFMQNGSTVANGGDATGGVPAIYFDDADYAVGSLTQKLRVRAQLFTNATAPAMTFTFGLHPIDSCGGGVGAVQVTANATAVSGSTVAFTSPSASTRAEANSGDFTIPADGWYALCVAHSGTPAANSRTLLSVQLQTRNV